MTMALAIRLFYKAKRNLLPGPKGLPVLGNVFQLPKTQQFRRFTEWSHNLAQSCWTNTGGSKFAQSGWGFVRFIMATEISCGNLLLSLRRYGDLWQKMRKAAHEGLNIRASEVYRPLQEKEAAILVDNMLKDPNSWDDHMEKTAASTVLTTVYGMESIKPKDDPLVARINDFVHRLTRAALPGTYLVEIFPVVRYLPEALAPWKKEGNE
ncbi:hypothetical protein D9758_011155 [Tetrapyrgos nigripes]|uniref:Cytochrome P450 n=1 Tax=Tetrapyrgos nigripes TaxID=182062 RepID=A0A8H5FN94_9AGAR|nr:hypothetical protein D9758_011155 [Tetrapyrgos nigripes]